MKIKEQLSFFFILMTLVSSSVNASSNTGNDASRTGQGEAQHTGLNNPTRYAFITDRALPKLAVFDTQKQSVLPLIDLQTTAEIVGINREGGYLFYAKRGDKALYRLDLTTRQQQRIIVEHNINDFVVQNGGKWLAYQHSAGVSLFEINQVDKSTDIKTTDIKTNDDIILSPVTTIATTGEVSLLFHPSQDSLFIAELSSGRLLRIDLKTYQSLTLLDVEQAMSPISVMPNGMALFFISDGRLQRYSLLDETLQALNIPATVSRPYITGDSRKILLLNKSPSTGESGNELLVVNAYTYKIAASHALKDWRLSPDNAHDYLRTGWLEQVAVLADDAGFYSLTLDDNNSANSYDNVRGSVNDMLVKSDSKTLLMTVENNDKLRIFDLRTRRFTAEFPLRLSQPDRVLMGETNTLCH